MNAMVRLPDGFAAGAFVSGLKLSSLSSLSPNVFILLPARAAALPAGGTGNFDAVEPPVPSFGSGLGGAAPPPKDGSGLLGALMAGLNALLSSSLLSELSFSDELPSLNLRFPAAAG